MNGITEFVVKAVGVAAITGAAFMLAAAMFELGLEWGAVAMWALIAAPAVYILWRVDLSRKVC